MIIFIIILIAMTALAIYSLYLAFEMFSGSLNSLREMDGIITIPGLESELRQNVTNSAIIAFSLLGTVLGTGYFLTKKVITIATSKEYKNEKKSRNTKKAKIGGEIGEDGNE
ncbi:MAG: hypothetical protein FWE22_06165 [Firmicutes bacterium]|nr:hypothetical protein [Bacillota bacterium]